MSKDYYAKAFGEVLKDARDANGFTQEKLAEKSLLDRTYISLLERGKRQPSLTTLFQIAVVLNLSPSTLVKLTEKKYHEIIEKRNSDK
ncbi:MAG: helix-turn-helix transcriptional regulator [Victivallaceae bacterium]|jgi:transcriptional regulator with XRE-family HTH domain